MKDTAEIARLRTLLRNVNMEYSALLRRTGHESKLARLGALKEQRLALMSRIAEPTASRGSTAGHPASM